jgi:tetratricopeptide (TPR) repeat protein
VFSGIRTIKLHINGRRIALLILLLLGIAGICLWSYQYLNRLSPEEVYEHVSGSVYIVEFSGDYSLYGTDPVSLGSGIAVSEDEVVTNKHVVREFPGLIRIRQGEKRWRGFVCYQDSINDICLLRVPGLRAKPIKVDPSIKVRIGDRAFAVGAPRGLERSFSDGLISGLRKSEDANRIQAIQTTAPISPGSSGGGLFDANGNLIGITTAYVRGGQNLNFAVPVSAVAEAMLAGRTEASRLMALGIAWFQKGDLQKAREILDRLVSLDPERAEAWYLRSLIEGGRKQDQTGPGEDLTIRRRSLREALNINPSFAEAWFSLAMDYELRAKAEIFDQAKELTSKPPVFTEAFLRKQYFLTPEASHDLEQAKVMLQKAMECSPTNIEYINQHADTCLDLKGFDDALGSIRKALSIDPKNIFALDNLAVYYGASALTTLSATDTDLSETTEDFKLKDSYILLNKEIETRIVIDKCIPKGSKACDLQALNAGRLLSAMLVFRDKIRLTAKPEEMLARMQTLNDKVKSLLDRETVQGEKDRAEAQSALVSMVKRDP